MGHSAIATAWGALATGFWDWLLRELQPQRRHRPTDQLDRLVQHRLLFLVQLDLQDLLDAVAAQLDGHAEADVFEAVLTVQVG